MRLPTAFIAVTFVAIALGRALSSDAQGVIKPGEAGAHVGKHRTVCGQVASAADRRE